MYIIIQNLLTIDLKKTIEYYFKHYKKIIGHKEQEVELNSTCENELLNNLNKLSLNEPKIKLEILFVIPIIIYAFFYAIFFISEFISVNYIIVKICNLVFSEIFQYIIVVSTSFHYIFKNVRIFKKFKIIRPFLARIKEEEKEGMTKENKIAIFLLFTKLTISNIFNLFLLVICILLSFEMTFLLCIGYSPIVEILWYFQGFINYDQYLYHWNYSFEYDIIRKELKLNPFEADLFSNRYAKNRVSKDDPSYSLCKTIYEIIHFEFLEI